MCRLALFVYVVAVCVHSLPSCGATDYYVRPTQPASISCPGQPCLTFSQYANNLSSNATYHFMAGVHAFNGSIVVRKVMNVSLLGFERNANLPQLISECSNSGNTSNTYVECFGIRFKDVRGITISSLILKMPYATTGLTFIDSTVIVLQTLCVSIIEVTNSPIQTFSIIFSNTTDVQMNSLAIAHEGIHVTHSIRVKVSNVSLENGIMNFTQTIDVHITDITTCDPFDLFGLNNGYTSTCSSDIVVLESRDVIILLNSFNTTITNVTIHYAEKDGISLQNTFNTTITNGIIHYTRKDGITLMNTSNTTITNVTIHSTEIQGVTLLYTFNTIIIIVTIHDAEKDGIVLLDTFNTTITNVTIHDAEKDGIVLLDTFNTTITNVTINYTKEAGIYLLRASITEAINIIIHYAGRVAIEMMMSRGSIVSNVHMKNMNDEGIIIKQSQGIEINGLVILNGVYGIHFIAVNNSNITNCTTKYTVCGICMEDIRQINVKNTQVLHSLFNPVIIESVVDTLIKSLTIINWTEEAVYATNLKNTNLVHLSLRITTNLTTYDMNGFHGIVLYNCSDVTISRSNFTNIPSFDKSSDVAFQPSVISLYYSEKNIIIRDCSFEGNNITGLTVVQSKVRISGNVNFIRNRAYRGVAMTFTQGGKMILSEDSHITFKNNYARTTGGAIYLTTTYTKTQKLSGKDSLKIECFIQVEGGCTQHHLTFLNNRAGLGGNELYGGGLQYGHSDNCNESPQGRGYTCLDEFLTVSDIKNTTLSNISSDPSRVCLCVDEKPDCLHIYKTVQTNGHGPYPGQTITISAVVVGQNFGTVSGSVYAQLINFPFNNNTPTLDQGQETQGVNHNSCNNLQYTINSPVEYITIMLTSVKLKETFTVTEQTFTETKKEYERYENNRNMPFPRAMLEFPIYINIPLEPCPPGFSITHKHPVTCDCVRQLRELPGVTCDIEDVTIYRSGQVWVGQLKSTFNETDNDQMNVVSARYCPFNYCKNGGIKIHLSHSHDQCNYNHSGIVCGECIHDLSLVLGSDQCLNCSNTYLLLLLPFTVAGVVLVAFIKLLDITVSSGFINSLIFYTNIVKVNEHIFLPHRTTNPITLFMSWFNLDLGIETCFYDGLDAYAKAWLQFVFPFYLWCIVGLIIISARYSTKFARLTGNNSVPVLATLFLLSYAKLLRNVITILSYTTVDTAQGQKVVWSADGNIDYLGPQHVPLFTAAIVTLILLWLPYTTLFLCGQWVCTINLSFITRMSMKLKPFLDAHYGPLTDKHRYWFGILLGVRIVVFLISATLPASNFSISAFSVCIAAGALVSYMAIGPPLYRNKHVAVFEVALFINLALLGLTKFYVVSTDGNQTAATLTLLTVAFVQFLGLVLYRGYSTLKPVFTQYYQRLYNKEEEEDEVDGEQRDGVWRYDTSMREWEKPQNLTPYTDATVL